MRFTFGVDADEAYRRVESGAADYALDLPADAHEALGATYGIRSGRYRVNPAGCLLFLALRTDSRVFAEAERRRAPNFALDRSAMTDIYTSAFGAYAVSPTDQYVTPGFPGFRDTDLYPLTGPDVTRARELAEGHMPVDTARLFGAGNLARLRPVDGRARLVRANRPRRPAVAAATPAAAAGGDLPPHIVRRHRRSGRLPRRRVHHRRAAPRRETDRRRLAAAPRLAVAGVRGAGSDLARREAPAVAWGSVNDREFFSERVDPRTILYQPFVGGVDYAALALR